MKFVWLGVVVGLLALIGLGLWYSNWDQALILGVMSGLGALIGPVIAVLVAYRSWSKE